MSETKRSVLWTGLFDFPTWSKKVFPRITHIDDVLPHVAGRDDFIVVEKDGYTVIDYVLTGPDTFSGVGSEFRRECRGLKFAPDGKLLARPFHKFFNFGEKPETTEIDWSRPHRVYTKLDGSMVHPALVRGELVFMTRMGVTDQAKDALRFAAQSKGFDYIRFCRFWMGLGFTPIFEWTAPQNRIVIEYESEALTLLALRCNETGRYVDLQNLNSDIPTPTCWDVDTSDAAAAGRAIDHIRTLRGEEGVVIQFDTLFVKVKADEYVAFHRAKDACSTERRVLPLVLEGKHDDVLPLLSAQDRADLETYAWKVNAAVNLRASTLGEFVHTARMYTGNDQKTFATKYVTQLHHPALRAAAFLIWNYQRPASQALREVLLKQCVSNAKINDIRDLIGGAVWRDRPELACAA